MMMTALALCMALFAAPQNHLDKTGDLAVADQAYTAPTRPAVALGFEGSLHGFAGSGVVASLNPTGRFTLDGGFGWAPAGFTTGLRGRFNFMRGPLRPFVGLGLSGSFGTTRQVANGAEAFATIDVPASMYMQAMAGGSYARRNGLFLLWGVGYQRLLGDSNVRVRSGYITKQEFVRESQVLGSGLMLALSVGYTI